MQRMRRASIFAMLIVLVLIFAVLLFLIHQNLLAGLFILIGLILCVPLGVSWSANVKKMRMRVENPPAVPVGESGNSDYEDTDAV